MSSPSKAGDAAYPDDDSSTLPGIEAESAEELETLDEAPQSIVLEMLKNLKKGADLSKITFPIFVLEPRSMLERITDFMSHPDLLIGTLKINDPLARFVAVTKYFLSGWYIKPKGVKKPYNPVLGEFFRCKWQLEDGSESMYISEQVSHHPPVSAYYYCNPQNRVVIEGDLRPKSRFFGNSVGTIMHGASRISFGSLPGEEYIITMPNMYARGILFGTMMLELGDHVVIRCDKTDLICELEFKTKGMWGGTYHAISGKIKRMGSGEVLYTISGKWNEVMYLEKHNGGKASGSKEVYFDTGSAKIRPKTVAAEESQEKYESRRLWSKVTKGLTTRDLDFAQDEKAVVEDQQRWEFKERDARKLGWTPRFFKAVAPSPERSGKESKDGKEVCEEEYAFIGRAVGKDSEEIRSKFIEHVFNNPPPDMHLVKEAIKEAK